MVGKGRDDLVFTDLRGGVLRVSNYRTRVFAPAVAQVPQGRRRVPDDHSRTICGIRRPAWRSAPAPM